MTKLWALLLAVALMWVREAGALDIPPINWSGRLGSTYRLNKPDQGERTFQRTYTGEIAGDSYLWKPWFGRWRTRLALSASATDSESDTDSTFWSGDGRFNLFHMSRFPLDLFFNVQDSRVDFSDGAALLDENNTRFMRLGLTQRYQSADGRGVYDATLLRDELKDLVLNSTDVTNRAIMNGFLKRERHTFGAAFLLDDRHRTVSNADALEMQLNLSHSYSPNPRLSVETSGTMGLVDASNDTGSFKDTNARVNSQVFWRSERLPLTLRGLVFLSRQDLDAELSSGDRKLDEGRVSGFARYLINPNLSAGLDLGASFRSGDIAEQTTFQTGSLTYLSSAYPLGKFDYSWNGSVALRNNYSSISGADQIYGGVLGHGLNRRWLLEWGFPFTAVFNAHQEIRGEENTLEGALTVLVNRASATFNANVGSGSSYMQFLLQDTRNSGRLDDDITQLSLIGVHNHRFSRYSDFNASYGVFKVRQSGITGLQERDDDELFLADEFDRSRDSTNLDLTYRHSKVFRVNRLRFQSRLQFRADSLLLSDFRAEGGELVWENRFDYTIGKLDIRLRTAIINRRAETTGNKLAILSIIRRF